MNRPFLSGSNKKSLAFCFCLWAKIFALSVYLITSQMNVTALDGIKFKISIHIRFQHTDLADSSELINICIISLIISESYSSCKSAVNSDNDCTVFLC